MTHVRHAGLSKFALIKVHKQLVLFELFLGGHHVKTMQLITRAVNQDVVEEDENKLSKVGTDYVIH